MTDAKGKGENPGGKDVGHGRDPRIADDKGNKPEPPVKAADPNPPSPRPQQ